MKVKDYKELLIWQQGIEIVDKLYSITKIFPGTEIHGLTNQIRRAAVSIPSNIAEGFMRQHTKEFSQFLRIALGSYAEIDTQLTISKRQGYISDALFEELTRMINQEMRMIMGLLKNLKINLPTTNH